MIKQIFRRLFNKVRDDGIDRGGANIDAIDTFNGSIVVGTQINRIEDPATSAALQSSLVVLQQAMSLNKGIKLQEI
jgi:hypothetical protein